MTPTADFRDGIISLLMYATVVLNGRSTVLRDRWQCRMKAVTNLAHILAKSLISGKELGSVHSKNHTLFFSKSVNLSNLLTTEKLQGGIA